MLCHVAEPDPLQPLLTASARPPRMFALLVALLLAAAAAPSAATSRALTGVVFPCLSVQQVFDQWNISTLPALARASGTYTQLVAGNQTLLVPIDSSYPPHFGANTSTDKLAGYVLYNIIPGQFPTHSLHNLQRLYGRLDGVDVAVKVPKVGHAGHIQVLGIYGDTVGRIVHKNLTACGSVYIHLMDAPVLPYTVK